MAVQLPTFADLPTINPRPAGGLPSYPDSDPGAVGEAALGKGVSAAGGAIEDFVAENQRKKDRLEQSGATTDLFTRLTPLLGQISKETDPARVAELRGQIDTLLPTSGQGISNPYARQLWTSSHGRTIAQAHKDANDRDTVLDRNAAVAQIHERIDRAVRTAADADDPQAFETGRLLVGNELEYGKQYGALLPTQAYELGRRAQIDMTAGRLDNLIARGRVDEASVLLKQNRNDLGADRAAHFEQRIAIKNEKAGVLSDTNEEWGSADKGYAGNRGNIADRIIGAESGGKDVKNPLSSASGPGQFIDSTWLAMVKSQAPDVAAGKTDAQILALKGDKTLARQMTAAYGDQNKAFLADRGLPTDDGAIYLAHFLGPAGAASVLQADPSTPIAALIPEGAMKANPQLAGKTAADVRRMTAERVGSPTDVDAGSGDAPAASPADNPPISGTFPRGPDDQSPVHYERAGGGWKIVNGPAPEQSERAAAASQSAPGLAPLPDIDAMTARVQARADSGKITQDRANAVQAALRARYNHVQAAQATDRAAFTRQISNGAAALEDGHDFEYNPITVRHFFPKEKADEIIQTLDDAKAAGQVMAGVRTASPEDLGRQEQQLAAGLQDPNATDYSRRRKQAAAFDSAVKRRQDALGKDPAGYVAQYSPSVVAKYAAIDPNNPATFSDYATTALAEQARLGVPEESRSVLPAGQASAVASKLASLDPAKVDIGRAMSDTAKSYGDYWPQVFGDLVRAKLPSSYQVIATMDRPDQAVAAADLSRAQSLIAEKGGMSALKKSVPDDKQKAIDKSIDDSLADFRESVGAQSGGPRLYATVRDSAQSLAYYYAFRGASDSEAVQKAVDGIVNNKYDFGSIGASQVRVPKGAMNTIDTAARTMQAGLPGDDFGPVPGNPLLKPEERKDIWLGAIRNGGWANNEDDSGLVLMGKFRNGAMSAVRRADGSRVVLKFDDAPAIAQTAPLPVPANPEDIGARPR